MRFIHGSMSYLTRESEHNYLGGGLNASILLCDLFYPIIQVLLLLLPCPYLEVSKVIRLMIDSKGAAHYYSRFQPAVSLSPFHTFSRTLSIVLLMRTISWQQYHTMLITLASIASLSRRPSIGCSSYSYESLITSAQLGASTTDPFQQVVT